MIVAEFLAMKIVTETLQGIKYKLRMMGGPIFCPSHIYGDHMSVIHNTQCNESTLKNKCNYICYQSVHGSVAKGESLTGHVGNNKHCAELSTKVLYGGKHNFHV